MATDDLDSPTLQRIVGVSHGDEAAVQQILASDVRYAQAISYVDEAAVEAAAHTGRASIARRLLDAGAPLSLPTCITMGDLDRARQLLEEDPLRIHERGAHDFALMWYPILAGGNVDALALLLEFGADIEQESQGATALHFAVQSAQLEMAEALLDEGADTAAVSIRFDRRGETPLDVARRIGAADLVTLLKKRSRG